MRFGCPLRFPLLETQSCKRWITSARSRPAYSLNASSITKNSNLCLRSSFNFISQFSSNITRDVSSVSPKLQAEPFDKYSRKKRDICICTHDLSDVSRSVCHCSNCGGSGNFLNEKTTRMEGSFCLIFLIPRLSSASPLQNVAPGGDITGGRVCGAFAKFLTRVTCSRQGDLCTREISPCC